MKFALALIGLVSVQAVLLKQKNQHSPKLLVQEKLTPAELVKQLDADGNGTVSWKEIEDIIKAQNREKWMED